MIPIPFNQDDVPHIPEELVYEEKEGGMWFILAPELPNCISVNAEGKNIIDICDGRKTILEITETISEIKKENPAENLGTILNFFRYMENKKFAFMNPVEPDKFTPREADNLVSLWLNITYTCNLRCRHCHSSFGTPLEDELETEELIRIIKEASLFPGCSLVISGGEPFCREDIFEILETASEHFGNNVTVITNGTLLDDEKVRKLAELTTNVQISLEGPCEESNDAIRGKGVFKKALKAIKCLKRAGITPLVRMTILRTNMDKMDKIIEFVKQENVGPVTMGTLQMSGRAYESLRFIDLTTDELVRTYRHIKELDPHFEYINFNESLRPGITRFTRLDLCGAGTAMLSIGADGGVYPCAGLMYPEFLAGNVKETPLEEIWLTAPVLTKIRDLSVSKIPGCKDCSIRYLCGGGCLVDIFWEHGNLQGKTPRCELLHALKWDELKRTEYKTQNMG